jgi:hypothetical protein
MVLGIKLPSLLVIFVDVQVQFRILSWIRIQNLELRIRIRQKVSDPCGSGFGSESPTLQSSIDPF